MKRAGRFRGRPPQIAPNFKENTVEEEFEIDPQDLLLENSLRVVFRAAQLLDGEDLSAADLKNVSGALRDATDIILAMEHVCSCMDEDGAEGE